MPIIIEQEGHYILTDLKDVRVTEEFLGLGQEVTKCQNVEYRTEFSTSESCPICPIDISSMHRDPSPVVIEGFIINIILCKNIVLNRGGVIRVQTFGAFFVFLNVFYELMLELDCVEGGTVWPGSTRRGCWPPVTVLLFISGHISLPRSDASFDQKLKWKFSCFVITSI